ncbi:class I SAM-dependent methyltransferase [Phenylobacterium sp.]|uniref:class I SAM-dependent methyltransferase n=1 Tax=Phenylobacterium sp. TaxID=1871053 RepID=UPI002FE042B9
MKFNMGCGQNKQPGYVNVDAAAASEPDEVVDLEVTPWPWPDGCAEEIVFNHALEHMGGDPKVFLAIMREIYRIAAPGGLVRIHVPHPRHDNFINDPTHVRPITPQMLELFDRPQNERWRQGGVANTPLALYLDVDFELVRRDVMLEEPYRSRLKSGALTVDEAQELLKTRNNIAAEFRIEMVAHKPPRTTGPTP